MALERHKQLERRTPLKRGEPLKRETPLKRTEMKRKPTRKARENAAALAAATPFLIRRSRGRCEAHISRICTGGCEHRHHRRRVRSDNRVENLLFVCNRCHEYIHRHPQWAYAVGFLLRRSQDPTEVPVVHPRRVG